jgi:hypothetical protein
MAGTHKRVLLLGPTGVDKAAAMQRVLARMDATLGHKFRFVDFENEFLKPRVSARNWVTFLAQDLSQQVAAWRRAWDDFKKTLDGEMVVLGLHSTYVSGILGLRCPVQIPSICGDFQPSLIISLVDDVFQMWHRTETRAQGEEIKGRPTFEQLLTARRAEQLLGDIILSHTDNPKARHILCAAGNNIDALTNIMIFDAPVTYLSFPITAPRELAKSGDMSFTEIINQAHQLAATEMAAKRQRAFISPLSIDELPLVFKAKADEEAEKVTFNCKAERWNPADLWGDENLAILPCMTDDIIIPMSQIENASSAMQTDVGWRDRRLVLQSASLAIVCPKPPNENRITRGVEDEIQTAIAVGIMCNYWQEPKWDTGDFVGKRFPPAGSMGIGQTQALVQKKASLDELIRAAL